jgi:hypothetical protein
MESINTSQHTGAFNFPESVPQPDQLGQNLDEEKLQGKAQITVRVYKLVTQKRIALKLDRQKSWLISSERIKKKILNQGCHRTLYCEPKAFKPVVTLLQY